MGCAGSKPHLPSLSSNHHHLNSPQKGFILFNAKTIEYLSANEVEIKTKLIQRCEAKLIKNMQQSSSSKSLLGNAKRTLLSTSHSTQNAANPNNTSVDESIANQSSNNVKSNKSNLSLANSTASSQQTAISNDLKHKEFAIYSAVDYVLKYAINDFDIENFKSSNHLSMKQIRKDIMKKYSSSRQSTSKLNSSISNAASLNNTNNSNTLNAKDATSVNTMTLKTHDSAFYKLALHTTIDEFGSFIQENFININEFQPKEKCAETTENKENINDDNRSEASSINDHEALKLKEALEVARQNFYKGKISMVCLNKAGGYVVKEVKEKDAANTTLSKSPTKSEDLGVKAITTDAATASPTSRQQQDLPTIQLPDASLEEQKNELKQADSLEEFLKLKSDMASILSQTIEYIVNYTTKSAIFNDTTSLEFDNETEKLNFVNELQQAFDHCVLLRENLEKSNHIIDIFSIINEKDYTLVDEKLVDTTVNLDYVNKEFMSYLKLLDESLKQQFENCGACENTLAIKDNLLKILDWNSAIRKLVEELSQKIAHLPTKLFLSKGLPHPLEANGSPSLKRKHPVDAFAAAAGESTAVESRPNPIIRIENVSSVSPAQLESAAEIKSSQHEAKEETPATSSMPTQSHSQQSHHPINIKKEIAYSILNIGEVLAKTIDYYSLDVGKDGQPNEELNELIKLSERQAALEKKKLDAHAHKAESSSSSGAEQNKSAMNKSASSTSTNSSQSTKQEQTTVVLANKELNVNTMMKEPSSSVEDSKVAGVSVALVVVDEIEKAAESSVASSLSSPSLSNSLSSPLSASGSASPVQLDVKENDETKLNGSLIQHGNNKSTATASRPEYDDLEKVKSASLLSNHDVSIQDEDIAYLVKEINMNMKLSDMTHKLEVQSNEIMTSVNNLGENSTSSSKDGQKSSSSSSDILSSYNIASAASHIDIVNKYIENIIESAATRVDQQVEVKKPVVFRNSNTNDNNNKSSGNDSKSGSKRVSLDEELLYQLEQVDKKVKYMNETCSENEDDADLEDLDDENFDFDESNSNDGEKLFHPRTPAKIKHQVRQNRAVDLHEEIKQISNVIQDLVQTINVRTNGSKVIDGEENANSAELVVDLVGQSHADHHDHHQLNSNSDNGSEDGSHNSGGSLGDNSTQAKTKKSYSNKNGGIESTNIKLNVNVLNSSNNSGNSSPGQAASKMSGVKRNGSTNSSNIPIRQKVLTKQKATSIEADVEAIQLNQNHQISMNSESFKSAVNDFESFVDLSAGKSNKNTPDRVSTNKKSMSSSPSSSSTSSNSSYTKKSPSTVTNNTPTSQKFRSKLPVKK